MPFLPFVLFFCFFSFSSWSLVFDWSGWTRMESYYQHPSNYYGTYNLVLQPKIQVIDSLDISGRLELRSLKGSAFSSSLIDRQTGLLFLYKEGSDKRDLKIESLYLGLSQMYVDYQSEFFKLRLGRAPYHFGLGTSHSASLDPSQHWITIYNQALLYVEYSDFYFQPAIFYQGEVSFLGSAQAGISKPYWKAELLYQNDFEKYSFIELFGKYKKTDWELKASASYVFDKETNASLALEALFPFFVKIPFQLEIKSGGIVGENLAFHPNYDLALIFWNRYMSSGEGESLQVAHHQLHSGLYFSPRLLFSFWKNQLKVRPLFLIAGELDEKKLNYEFDLEGFYHPGENVFFSLKGGAFYSEELHFALLAQAAVSF